MAGKRKKRSLSKAVEAFCKHCLYDPFAAGSWRMQIEACHCVSCPLWEVRPVRPPSQSSSWSTHFIEEMGFESKEEAIRWQSDLHNPNKVPKFMSNNWTPIQIKANKDD